MKIQIYALIENKTKSIRYVGMTSISIENRFRRHIKGAKEGSHLYISRWLRKIKFKAHPILLETVPSNKSWQKAEQKWIAYYRAKGARLTNLTDGGDGVLGRKVSKAFRLKVSERTKGKKYALGFKHDDIMKRNKSIAMIGNQNTLGFRHSESSKLKMSKIMKEIWRKKHAKN